MTRRAALRATALGALVLGLSAGGCAQGSILDGARTEGIIRDRLVAAYDVEVDAVECPDEIAVEDGGEFRCRAVVGDATVGVEVLQTDGDGTLVVTPDAALLATDAVEADIAVTLADRFERDDVEVMCDGPAIRVEEPDATFTCEAVDGEETEEVEVRVRDVRGALTYALADD